MPEKATTPGNFPSFRRRLAAMVYEAFLIFAVSLFAGFAYLPLFGSPSGPFDKAVFQLYLMLVLMVYFLIFWTRGGQTLAMKTWHIRLADLHGNDVSVPRGIVRFLLALVGLTCFGLGFLWALVDTQHQFLHDRLARTRLVLVD